MRLITESCLDPQHRIKRNAGFPTKSKKTEKYLLPVDAGHAGHVLLVADPLGQKSIADLPGEHCRILLLVLADGVHHGWGRHLGLAAPDHARLEVARLVVAAQKTKMFFVLHFQKNIC